MPRPSKLNEELIKQFEEEVEDGLPLMYCCHLLEITDASFSNWMKQGKEDFECLKDSIEAMFFSRIKKAYSKYIRHAKKRIRAGEQGWQGEAWWLERTNTQFVLSNDGNESTETVIVNPGVKPNLKK